MIGVDFLRLGGRRSLLGMVGPCLWHESTEVERMPEQDWVSVPVAAEMLGCSDVWVIRMIQNGALEGFRLSGRAWAVSRKSVEKNRDEYLNRDPSLAGRKRSRTS